MPSDPGFGEKLRTVFGLSPTILCLTGVSDGRIRDANDAFLRTSGYTREEMLGKSKMELGFWVTDEQREREVAFRTRAGEERRLLVNSEVITFGGEPAVLSVSLDITERSQHEARMRERREEAEAL